MSSKNRKTENTDATPTSTASDRELVLTCIIDAPRERVFGAWTDPDLLKQWFAPLPYTTPVAELDVRPGAGGKTKYTARVRHWTVADREAHEKMGFHQGLGECADQLAPLVTKS